ncbi:hypothetical protein BH11MYX2_BH11MYX2_04720 [soil metagenome]
MKRLERVGEIRESVIGWFYRARAAERFRRKVTVLITTLEPEYAEALEQIDVEGTVSNAGVRVFRGRAALSPTISGSPSV